MHRGLEKLTLFIENGDCLLDVDKDEQATEWNAIFDGSRRAEQRYVRVADVILWLRTVEVKPNGL